MTTQLSHFSGKPVTLDSRTYRASEFGYKPIGFWLSDESEYGWKQWSNDSGYGNTTCETKFQVGLKNILVLSTPEMIDAFTEEYGTPKNPGVMDGRLGSIFLDLHLIHWDKVTAKYDGILITPYVWEYRRKYLWYNTWDCASGCVWNVSCLTKL